MATELLRPGVSVIQEFRTVSPTIVTPTLVPCAIAPCFQIIEAYATDANGNAIVNSEAVATVPAILNSSTAGPYAGLNGLTLKVRVDGGPTQEVTFTGVTGSLSASQVKDKINAATRDGWAAYVRTLNSSTYIQLRTTMAGDHTLQVLNGDANPVLGFNNYYTAYGTSAYKQNKLYIEQLNFPDPRGNIDEVDVDESSIRVFVNTGTTTLTELKRTEAFLRRGQKASLLGSAAVVFPTTALTGKTLTLTLAPAGSAQTVTFVGEETSLTSLVATINTLFGATVAEDGGSGRLRLLSSAGYIKVGNGTANAILDPGSTPTITNNADQYTVEPVDDGDGDSKTPLLVFNHENFAAAGGSASLVGTVTLPAVEPGLAIHNKTFIIELDGNQPQEIVFDAGPIVGGVPGAFPGTWNGETIRFHVNGVLKDVTFVNPADLAAVAAQINAVCDGLTVAYVDAGVLKWQVGGATRIEGGSVDLVYDVTYSTAWADLGLTGTANIYQTMLGSEIVSTINATMGSIASLDDNKLKLLSTDMGDESKIKIGLGTANADLGFTNNAYVNGNPFPPAVGDKLYVDGVYTGKIIQVMPGGVSTMLRVDTEVDKNVANWRGVTFYIVAQNIPDSLPSTRPTPNLVVDAGGAVHVGMDIFRDTTGAVIEAQGQLLIMYKGLRLDVSTDASEPSLLTVTSTKDIEDALSPVNADNPLALMLYFMSINAPGIECTGIGVNGVSSTYPDGTPEAYNEAITFLEGQEVWGLAPATQEGVIHQAFMTHVDDMSDPDNKGERVVFINPKMPREAIPTIVSSGTDGDSTGTLNEFDTKLATLATDLLAAGIDPSGPITVEDGVYLDIARDVKKYSISGLSGTVVTIRVAFAPGENDDGFYSSTNLPGSLISETFGIYIRGEKLVTSTGKLDYSKIAQAYQDLGKNYGNRRVIMVAPDYCAASIESVEQQIKGYYMCAAIAGMCGQQAPQQGFTNFPMTGFTRVIGSNDVFSEKQMSVAAAGGTYWVIQEVAGGPLTCRHQLTTDLTSIETRELSITKVVDFVAKFMRIGLRNFIGKFNITQPFLDTLSTVVQGQLGFLTESGVIIGGDLNNIVQDTSVPDTVLIDVTLDVPFPCNHIRLTLII